MEFPNTPQTHLTERIMRAIRSRTDRHESTKLDNARYNRIYEAVYDTLATEPAAPTKPEAGG
jgi:hypothetical protein